VSEVVPAEVLDPGTLQRGAESAPRDVAPVQWRADVTSDQTPLDRELAALTTQSEVDADLARLKAEVGGGPSRKELDR
jgi:phage shock protein A